MRLQPKVYLPPPLPTRHPSRPSPSTFNKWLMPDSHPPHFIRRLLLLARTWARQRERSKLHQGVYSDNDLLAHQMKHLCVFLSAPKSHNLNRQRFPRWRSQIARNPAERRGSRLRNHNSKSQIASDLPSHSQSQCKVSEIASDFWGPRWASQSQIARIDAISVR